MTDAELDSSKPLAETRLKWIAIGSGATMDEIHQLLEEHKRFASMVSKMSDSKLSDPN